MEGLGTDAATLDPRPGNPGCRLHCSQVLGPQARALAPGADGVQVKRLAG